MGRQSFQTSDSEDWPPGVASLATSVKVRAAQIETADWTNQLAVLFLELH